MRVFLIVAAIVAVNWYLIEDPLFTRMAISIAVGMIVAVVCDLLQVE